MVRVFYRNRSGKDTKIISWSSDLGQAPANAYQLAVDLDLDDGDLSYQATNTLGVPLKKIVDGAVADRDAADIAKDINNKQHLYQTCELDIVTHLYGKEKVTWVGAGAKNLYVYLSALQDALGVADGSLSAAGQTAKATLNWMKANVNDPIEAAMATRDAAIALLDVED